MFSHLALLIVAGLFFSGCLHPFQQTFSSSHDVNFIEMDGFAVMAAENFNRFRSPLFGADGSF